MHLLRLLGKFLMCVFWRVQTKARLALYMPPSPPKSWLWCQKQEQLEGLWKCWVLVCKGDQAQLQRLGQPSLTPPQLSKPLFYPFFPIWSAWLVGCPTHSSTAAKSIADPGSPQILKALNSDGEPSSPGKGWKTLSRTQCTGPGDAVGFGAGKGLAAAKNDAANMLVMFPTIKHRSVGRAGDHSAAVH